MHIKIKRKDLRQFLSIVNFKQKIIPVLSYLKIAAKEDISITATDLDLTISKTFEGEVLTPGECLLNMNFLRKICKTTDTEDLIIEFFDTEDRWTPQFKLIVAGKYKITCGESEFLCFALDPLEFPICELVTNPSFAMNTEDFWEGIRLTTPFATKESSRFILSAVLFDTKLKPGKTIFRATDGHRGSTVEKTAVMATEEISALIPIDACKLLLKIRPKDESVIISCEKSNIRFKFDDYDITTRLLIGTFPNLDNVLPQGTTFFRVNANYLRKAVRIAQVGMEQRTGVGLFMDKKQIKILGLSDEQRATAKIETLDTNTLYPVMVMFKPEYLLDFLKVNKSEQIEIKFDITEHFDRVKILNLNTMCLEGFKQAEEIGEKDETVFKYVVMPLHPDSLRHEFEAEFPDGIYHDKTVNTEGGKSGI